MRRAVLILLAALCGCGTHYFPRQQEQIVSLRAGDLEASGIAFITPSTVTGQEQEKQAVALTVASVLKSERPKLRVVTLAETLGAINQAGLADAYKRMYDDYRDTGLLSGEVLKRLGAATGARYIAQLKLQGFKQDSKNRFGTLGFRIVDTQIGDIRLTFQIWDASNGTIAWEGMQEMRLSRDSVTDEPVMLSGLVERAAGDLIAKLP
jgi:hypothetical protein